MRKGNSASSGTTTTTVPCSDSGTTTLPADGCRPRERGFATALEIIRLPEDDISWRDIADELGVNRGTTRRLYDRKGRYLTEAEAIAHPPRFGRLVR